MMRRKLTAGDIIEARCTKCRAVLNHRIVAMVEDRVVRVECNTCGGVHNFYPPGESKAPTARAAARGSAPAPRKVEKKTGKAERDEWESLYNAVDRSRAVPYDINGKFKVSDLVEHPVFGFGFVKSVIKPNKMEVLFEEGRKLLRCSA